MFRKRPASFIMAVILMLSLLLPAWAESVPAALPLSRAASAKDGTVRVHLATLGSPTALDVTVSGGYSVDGAVSLTLYDGQRIGFAFNAVTGDITMTVGSATYDMGREASLRRHQASGSSGLYIAQAKRPGNLYEGDLQLIARPSGSEYRLYAILHVFIETYLHGVVPHEMSSSWPLEALKAQAISARTYTYNRMVSQASALFDLGDTASHQVYYGASGSDSRAVQAVDETAGIVLMYGGSVAGTYYTASNGGQTESARNIWGGTRYPYLAVKDDPYDAANPNANTRTRTVYSDFDHPSQYAALQTLLRSAAGAEIRSINGITLHTPKYASPSRLYTKADFYLTMESGASKTVTVDIFDGLESAMNMSITSYENELWSVTDGGATFMLKCGRWGHGVGMSQRGAQQMANMGFTAAQILGFYYEGCTQEKQNFTASVLPSIGSGATVKPTAPPMSAGEQLAYVDSTASTLNLRSGPSTEHDIIAEIPRGTLIVVTFYGSEWCAVRWNNLTGYVMTSYLDFDVDVETSVPTAAPGQTAAPTPAASPAPSGETAVLTADADLRGTASSSGTILLMIPSGESVTVLTWGTPWTLVSYSGLTGYLPTASLQSGESETTPTTAPTAAQPPEATGEPTATPTAVPTPEPTPVPTFTPVDKMAILMMEGALRAEPSNSSEILLRLPVMAEVHVHIEGNVWSQVTYDGVTGWILTGVLHFTSATPPPAPTEMIPDGPIFSEDLSAGDPVTAWVAVEVGQTALYREADENGDVLAELPGGTQITLLAEGSAFSLVEAQGVTGYVRTGHIAGEEPAEVIGRLYVNTKTDPLTLRDIPQTTGSKAILYIPRGAQVRLIADLGDWAYIQYSGKRGYSAMRYLSRTKPEETVRDENVVLDVTLESVSGWEAVVSGREGSAIDLREWCSTDAPLLCEIPDGEPVTLKKKGNIWCLINYKGRDGYCLTSRLALMPPAD